MKIDDRRLAFDRWEMGVLYSHFRHSRCNCCSPEYWRSVTWEGKGPGGRLIKARYLDEYPRNAPRVTFEPDVATHHRYDGGICLLRPEEWSPDFTVATIISVAYRFLEDFRSKKTGD